MNLKEITLARSGFGDGDGSITSDPEHYYAESGTYIVCLVIGDSALGCFDTYCQIWVGGIEDCIDESVMDTTIECTAVYEPVCMVAMASPMTMNITPIIMVVCSWTEGRVYLMVWKRKYWGHETGS